MATLTLEQFVFGHLEIPSAINFGGEQLEHTHQLAGGIRQVNAMGFSYDDITWSGYFDGLTSVFRAQYLYNLAIAGNAVSCTYDQFSYSVLIKKFTCNFQALPLPYTITLRVIQDLTVPVTLLAPLGFDDAILDDLYQLLTLAELVQYGGILGQVAALASTLESLASITGSSDAEIASITALVTSIGSAVGSATSTIAGNLFGGGGASQLPGATDTTNPDLPLDVQAADFDQLVRLYQMQNLTTRMLKNLALLGNSSNAQTVTLINPNLYVLAAQYYSDATLWTLIRDANNLDDFLVNGTTTLLIPPAPSTSQ